MDNLSDEADDLFKQAAEIVCQYNRASASLLQRRLSIGYARAARLIDQLEAAGAIAKSDGTAKPREVLITDPEQVMPAKEKKHKKVFLHPNKNYVPIVADFLPKEAKNLNVPTQVPIGHDSKDKFINTDLAEIGNLIITGNVISKKYDFLTNYFIFLLSSFSPEQIGLVIQDSSNLFLKYNYLPYLLSPVITEFGYVSGYRWLLSEIDRRIKLINEGNQTEFKKIVYIVNFSDFDIETEDVIKRITSIGASVGIHMILISDRLNDMPKSVKDNISARLFLDKFGKNKAIFEFDIKTEINIFEFDNRDVINYLSLISKSSKSSSVA